MGTRGFCIGASRYPEAKTEGASPAPAILCRARDEEAVGGQNGHFSPKSPVSDRDTGLGPDQGQSQGLKGKSSQQMAPERKTGPQVTQTPICTLTKGGSGQKRPRRGNYDESQAILGLGSATQGLASTRERKKTDETNISDGVLSQEGFSGLTSGELTATTARGETAEGQTRDAELRRETEGSKSGTKAETKTDNHGRPEREISPSQGHDEAKPPSRVRKADLPEPHWADPIFGSQNPNPPKLPRKHGNADTANPRFGAGNGDLHRPKGDDHTTLTPGPQEQGTAEGVENVDLVIAPANGDHSGQTRAIEGRPLSPIISYTKALGCGAASSGMLIARGDSQNFGAGNLGSCLFNGRLNDTQKGPINNEIYYAGMPKEHLRRKTPQQQDERGKLGEQRKGDRESERGTPRESSEGKDRGKERRSDDSEEGTSGGTHCEATIAKLRVGARSAKTDFHDGGRPGVTGQETREVLTQACDTGSDRRDPVDDEPRYGDTITMREIEASPCRMLNRDDHSERQMVATPVGLTVPARSPALIRTGIRPGDTGEVRIEVLEVGDWCSRNRVKVSGYDLDYHDGSIIVCINHYGEKNLHVTTEDTAFQIRFYRGDALLNHKLSQGQTATQSPIGQVGSKRLSRMSKGQIPLPRGCLPAMRVSDDVGYEVACNRGVALCPSDSRDAEKTSGYDEMAPEFEELPACGKETPPHKGVRVAKFGKLIVVARGNELSEGPRVRVADIPWGESEGIVILFPERRARPRSMQAWRHRKYASRTLRNKRT